MPIFNVSIELSNEIEAEGNYNRLRNRMNENGFKHSVNDKAGVTYRLPRDEFTYSGLLTRFELLDKVYDIVSEFIPAPGVMVTESAGRAWRGLKEIDLS